MGDFHTYLFNSLIDRKTRYEQLSSFTDVIESLPNLSFELEEENEIMSTLLDKKYPNRIQSIDDIKRFYNAIFYLDEKYSKVLSKFTRHVENILVQQI